MTKSARSMSVVAAMIEACLAPPAAPGLRAALTAQSCWVSPAVHPHAPDQLHRVIRAAGWALRLGRIVSSTAPAEIAAGIALA